MSNRILVVTQQGEARFLTAETTPTRVITIQPTGARGATGATGATGAGVAAGGVANDILKKTSSTDYATEWETPTSAATANAIVRRDASGGAAFDDLTAATVTATGGAAFESVTAEVCQSVYLGKSGSWGSTGFAFGDQNSIYAVYGIAATLTDYRTFTFPDASGTLALTSQANGAITSADITDATSSATANMIVRRDASGGAAFVALTGTGDWSTTGHFLSNPGTAEAGHFVTKNGTAPTIVAGRSAWFSSSTGDPQFRNGTSGAVTLIYDGGALGTPSGGTLTNCTGLPVSTGISGLGTNVATFLATPSSANLLAALTTSTGTGSAVFATSPTITTATAATASNTTPGLIISGPTSGVDTLQIRGTNTSSYSSIGLMDSANSQKGSFGFGGTTAGSYANTVFFNSSSGVAMTFGAGGSEKMRVSSAGGFSIGTTTDAGAGNLLLAGTITTVGPASSTARPMKFGSVTAITDASMVALGFTSQQKIEINAVAYWVPMKTSAWT